MKGVVLLENVDPNVLDGNIWKGGKKRRKYIDLEELLDINVAKYGGGNISNVSYAGKPKSNSWYRKNVMYAKLYIDLNTNELVADDLGDDLEEAVVDKYHYWADHTETEESPPEESPPEESPPEQSPPSEEKMVEIKNQILDFWTKAVPQASIKQFPPKRKGRKPYNIGHYVPAPSISSKNVFPHPRDRDFTTYVVGLELYYETTGMEVSVRYYFIVKGYFYTHDGKITNQWAEIDAGRNFLTTPEDRSMMVEIVKKNLGLEEVVLTTSEKLVVQQLPLRFDQLELFDSEDNKAQFLSQQVKYKKSKDFDNTGEWITTIEGEEYEIYKNMNTGWWNATPKTAKKLGRDSVIMGFTKKDATSNLLELIWESKHAQPKKTTKGQQTIKEKIMKMIQKKKEKSNEYIRRNIEALLKEAKSNIKLNIDSMVNRGVDINKLTISITTLRMVEEAIENGDDPIEAIKLEIQMLKDNLREDLLISNLERAKKKTDRFYRDNFILGLSTNLTEKSAIVYAISQLEELLAQVSS